MRHADLDLAVARGAGNRVDGGELKVINATVSRIVPLDAHLCQAAPDTVRVPTKTRFVDWLILIDAGYPDVVDAQHAFIDELVVGRPQGRSAGMRSGAFLQFIRTDVAVGAGVTAGPGKAALVTGKLIGRRI